MAPLTPLTPLMPPGVDERPTMPTMPWLHVLAVASFAALDAVLRLGRLHADEAFQMLEPAFHKVYGFGVLTWEWNATDGGIRNWAWAGIVIGALRLCDAVGLSDPQARRAVIEVPLCALHVGMLAAAFRLSARRVGAKLAVWCVWLVGLYGPILWFAGRTMTESLSAPFIVMALERLDLERRQWHVPFLAGVLLGLAEVFRYGSAAAILFVLLWLLATRRHRDLGLVTMGGAVMAGALALLDHATWGFSSLLRYLEFNVTSGRAAAVFGADPWYFYFGWLLLPPWAVVGLARWKRDAKARMWPLLVTGLGSMAVLLVTPHKERRFLYPTLVLLAVAGAPAFVWWVKHLLGEPATARRGKLLVAFGALSTLVFYVFPCPYRPARGEQFQLAPRAAREGHGVLLVNESGGGWGGYFHLGKNLPVRVCPDPVDDCLQSAIGDPTFDRALTWEGRGLAELLAAGFSVEESRGKATLLARDR